MKKFILLFAVMIAVGAYAQTDAEAPERKNWDREKLYGRVKSVTIEQYELNPFIGEYCVYNSEVYKFDKNGDVVEHSFSENEEGISKYKYVYDKNRNVVEEISFNPKGEIVEKIVYTYNEHGKVVDEILYLGDDLINCNYKLVRSYNDEGWLLGGVAYDGNGGILYEYSFVYDDKGQRIREVFEDIIYVFEYDDNGHRTSQATYSSDEISNSSTLFRYDDKGLCVEESWLDGEGNLDALVTMKYNDAGGLIEYLMYDSEGDIVEVFYAEYDEHGNMIEKYDSRSKGAYQAHYFYEYDEKGREVECSALFNTFQNRFVSSYDSHDNLILVDIYEELEIGDILSQKEIRKIEYRN